MIVHAKTHPIGHATDSQMQPGPVHGPCRWGMHGVLLLAIVAIASACSSGLPKEKEDSARALAVQARQAPPPQDYALEPGDKIVLKFPYNPELNDALQIRPDGKISVQLVGEVGASGRSISEVSAELKQRYTNVLRDPELTVNIDTYRSLVVYVGGEVNNPGVVALAPGMTVLQGILSAGGHLRTSDLKSVLIIREQGTEQPQMLLVNLDSALQALDSSDNLRLKAHDMVVVPMTGVAKAGVIVQQYINDLLPFSRSFNVNYDFYPQVPQVNDPTIQESQVSADISQPHVEPILQDVVNVVRRRKLVVVVTAIAAMLATFVALQFMTESYEAEARLMMVLGRENIQVPITVQNGGVFSTGVQREEINSEIQLLRSYEVISEAIAAVGIERFDFRAPPPQTRWQRIKYSIGQAKRWAQELATDTFIRIGLKKRLTPEEKAVKLISRSLDASRGADSNDIRVTLQLPDRDLAILTLNRLIENYQVRHVTIRTASTVLPLLEARVDQDRSELASLREERLGLIRTWGLASTANRSDQLQERLEKILYDTDSKRSELAESQQQLGALSTRTSSAPVSGQERQTESPEPAVRVVQEKLNELKMRRAELVSRYKDPSVPFIRQIDDQISALEALRNAEIDAQKTTTFISNPVRQTLEQQREVVKVAVVGLRAGIEEDKRHADALTRELAGLHDGESRLRMVDLSIVAAEKRFLLDSARLDEARVNATLDHTQVTNVVTLSAPNAAPEPVAPKKLRVLVFGVLAGILLGFGLGMLIEWSDDTVYGTRELLGATHLPYLGSFRIGTAVSADASRRHGIARIAPIDAPLPDG